MKKILSLFLCLSLISYGSSYAQCSGAVVDSVCYASLISSGGGICKDSLPQGMAGHPYSQDVSFVMPPSVDITTPIVATVTLLNIHINGIGGLPLGLDFACNIPSCVYHPSSGDELGALRVCGTPLIPGLYTLTVFILADVNVSGVGDRYGEAQTYTTTVRILPDTSGGVASFNYTPGGVNFCDTTDLTFHATISSATNPVKYAWTFGNGNTSTLKDPTIQTYLPSGTAYRASLKTTLYAYRLIRVKVNSTDGGRWSGDAGELYAGWPYSPDFVFQNTTTSYSTSEISNNNAPEWTGLRDTIPPGTDTIGFTLTDIDGSLFGLDPNDVVITDKLPVRLGNVNYISGSNSIQVQFDTVPYQIFYDTVSLNINDLPAPGITSISDDSICTGDTALITVNYGMGYSFQWKKDGVDIALANDSFLRATATGVYSVAIQNAATGCSTSSDASALTMFSNVSNVSIAVVAPGQIANTNYPGPGYTVEWYKDGVLIPGENGVVLNYVGDGAYTCHIFNPGLPRCGATSSAIVVSGINDVTQSTSVLSIYPNPSEGNFMVKFDVTQKDNYEMSIVDVVGHVVYTENLNNFKGAYAKQIDLSSLEKGLYFLHVVSKRSSSSGKIIIQ